MKVVHCGTAWGESSWLLVSLVEGSLVDLKTSNFIPTEFMCQIIWVEMEPKFDGLCQARHTVLLRRSRVLDPSKTVSRAVIWRLKRIVEQK